MKRSHPPYELIDIEATQPIKGLNLSRDLGGVAVLVRRNGRPVDFWMEAIPKGPSLTVQDIRQRIREKSGIALVKGSIRDELRPCVRWDRLPSVTVAVCTRDRTELLARCLRSLQAIDRVPFGYPVRLEILVVDNAPSTTNTKELVSSFPWVRYALEPIPGLDFARNRALKEAQGDLLAYIDDDAVVDGGWLCGLVEAWIRHPDAAAFTGQVLPFDLATRAQIIFEQRGGFRRGFDPIRYHQIREGDNVYPCNAGIFGTGANMAFQTHILRGLNGFDQALDTGPPLPAAGDHDIFYRIIRTGHSIVYTPGFLVFHEHRRQLRSLLRQYWSWGLGVMTFVDKCRQKDPQQQVKLHSLTCTWFREHLHELTASLLGQTPIPLYMVFAEMAGGLAGLMGGYQRTVRRTDQLRKRFIPPSNAGEQRRDAVDPGDSNNLIGRSYPNRFTPWEIRHVDMSRGIPSLSSDPQTRGVFVVFWWRDIPLGQHRISAEYLPMSSAELTEKALAVIAPAVGRHLLGPSLETPFSNESPETGDMDLHALMELDRPLERLEKRLSVPRAYATDASVSVVVCSRERPEGLRRCLDSLQGLTRKPQEIVVVDNAPLSDATRRVVEEFSGVEYIREPRVGLDIARNTGIQSTTGDIVAFTDDDAVVHPDWIGRMRQGFKGPDTMAFTGLVLPAQLETEAQYLFEAHWGFGRGYLPKTFGRRFFEKTRRHGVPTWEIGAGANMAFRRTVFDHVGLFDERLDVGAAGCSGDSEMWYRILAHGGTCRYDPTAVVYHYHRRGMAELHHQLYHYMRGHMTALLIQFERHRHWGNIRRVLLSLPRYYAGLILNGLQNGFSERECTLKSEILGSLAGIRYYLLKKLKNESHGLKGQPTHVKSSVYCSNI